MFSGDHAFLASYKLVAPTGLYVWPWNRAIQNLTERLQIPIWSNLTPLDLCFGLNFSNHLRLADLARANTILCQQVP